jgi:hypothetical protein
MEFGNYVWPFFPPKLSLRIDFKRQGMGGIEEWELLPSRNMKCWEAEGGGRRLMEFNL